MRDVILLLLGGVIGFFASIFANVATGPLVSLTSRYRIVTTLARIRLGRNADLEGDWLVSWKVESDGYPAENIDVTQIDSFLKKLAFKIAATGYGSANQYLFVGEDRGGVVSGQWYDPASNAYHGTFQLKWNGVCSAASGKWIGWAMDGIVKAGDLTLTRRSI